MYRLHRSRQHPRRIGFTASGFVLDHPSMQPVDTNALLFITTTFQIRKALLLLVPGTERLTP